MAVDNIRTVKTLAGELRHVPISEASLRWQILHAEENGLAPALIRRAGRVFVDKQAYERWLFTGSAGRR